MDNKTEGPSPDHSRRLVEQRLGYEFRDHRLLELALTHSSRAQEQSLPSNQRLEFLGDSVLGLVLAGELYRRFPELAEGKLSQFKHALEKGETLAAWADEWGLAEVISLGVGEDRSGGRAKPGVLADVFEAVVGAVYLDGGITVAEGLLRPLIASGIDRLTAGPVKNEKSLLQEFLQAVGRPVPTYRLVTTAGPAHSRLFEVDCEVDGETLGTGTGSSRQRAERAAAADAINKLQTNGTHVGNRRTPLRTE